MRLLSLAISSLALPSAGAYLVSPEGTPAPGATPHCSAWVQQSYSLSCEIITRALGIKRGDFISWVGSCLPRYWGEVQNGGELTSRQNPSTKIGDECVLIRGFYYCVEVNFVKTPRPVLSTLSRPPVSSTASRPPTTMVTSTTATTTGIATPTPIQAGMAGNCNRFRPVEPGDGCASIAAASGVALDDFYSWNPAVGATCNSLWAGYYVCVGVVGSSTTTSRAVPTTTSSGNGVATPTPIQSDMTETCKAFHLVISGDSCYDIASAAGVSLDRFYAWNPAVGNNCASLWVGYNVCVAVL